MSEKGNRMDGSEAATGARKDAWAWHPPLPLQGIPVFVWPPRPLAALKYLVSVAFLGSVMIPFGALAIVTWTYLQPALERCAQLQADWILQMYARNLALMLIVAGGLHLYFYTFKRQGSERKFDLRDLVKTHRRFFTGNQVRDNMLWSLASGVTFWTAYEAFFMWAYANDLLPYYLDWTAHPVLFVLMLLAIPFWASLHFYFIHRLLHWPPLYRIAHAVHHRNDNTGPWSGLSMHPIEHIIYLSSVLIHVVLASAPDPHPLSQSVEHPRSRYDTYGLRVHHVQGNTDIEPGVVPPPTSPPLLPLQLWQSIHAVGQMVRVGQRRHARRRGQDARTPACRAEAGDDIKRSPPRPEYSHGSAFRAPFPGPSVRSETRPIQAVERPNPRKGLLNDGAPSSVWRRLCSRTCREQYLAYLQGRHP